MSNECVLKVVKEKVRGERTPTKPRNIFGCGGEQMVQIKIPIRCGRNVDHAKGTLLFPIITSIHSQMLYHT